MVYLGVLATALFAQTAAPQANTPAQVEDLLRRAKNEYAYGNYDQAAEQLKGLLYPMRLTTDEQVIEARKLLGLSHYLRGDKEEAQEEFGKLLYLSPDYELDPYSIAPPVIELFESVRKKLQPSLDAIRQRKSDEKLGEATALGMRRVIENTVVERSDIATLLPFGAGQFQNGDVGWGVAFAVSELALLTANIGAFLWANSITPRADQPAKRRFKDALVVTQYGAAALFGVTWSIGVVQARLRFVPVLRSPPVIRDEPLGKKPGAALGLTLLF